MPSSGKTCRGQIGSYGFDNEDAAAYLAWGADYVKEDWCDADGLDLHTELRKRALALNATGKSFFYQCPCLKGEVGETDCWNPVTNGPPDWIGGLCDSWRFFDDHHDNWPSTSAIIQALALRAPFNKPGQWNDADFLMTGGQGCVNRTTTGLHCPGQTDAEYGETGRRGDGETGRRGVLDCGGGWACASCRPARAPRALSQRATGSLSISHRVNQIPKIGQAVTCGCLAADNFATPDPRPRIPYRYVSEFTLWALTASPLFLAADPRNMTALQRKVLLNGELFFLG